MSLFGLLDHLLNFVAPALLVGLLVAVLAPPLMKKARPHHSWLIQGAINSGAGVLALLAGLLIFGRDGKMATYAAMVLACASCQWFAAKAWRG
jgi:ABC-type enterochelin transport system permease subunit